MRECGDRLKIKCMGRGLLLIQSGSEEKTGEVLKAFDEWASFWLG